MSSSTPTNDLRNRIIFTLAILTVYRFGTVLPLGIDPEQLKIMMEGNQKVYWECSMFCGWSNKSNGNICFRNYALYFIFNYIQLLTGVSIISKI